MMQGLSQFEQVSLWVVLFVSLSGLFYAFLLRSLVLKEPVGDKDMQQVWFAIRSGAKAYLAAQLNRMHPIMLMLAVTLFFSVYIVPPSQEALERFASLPPDMVKLVIGAARVLAFIMGSTFSVFVGQI